MQYDSLSYYKPVADKTKEEQAILFGFVAKAGVLNDTKKMPPGIIKQLHENIEHNLVDSGLVLSPKLDLKQLLLLPVTHKAYITFWDGNYVWKCVDHIFNFDNKVWPKGCVIM